MSVFEEEEREEEREKKKKSSKSHLPVVAYTHARFPRSVPSHAAVCRTSGQINVSPVAENSCELGRREWSVLVSYPGCYRSERREKRKGWTNRGNWFVVYTGIGILFPGYRVRLSGYNTVFRADRSGPFGCAASTEAPFARSVRW